MKMKMMKMETKVRKKEEGKVEGLRCEERRKKKKKRRKRKKRK